MINLKLSVDRPYCGSENSFWRLETKLTNTLIETRICSILETLTRLLANMSDSPKVLVVLTSHDKLGDTGKPTGWYLVCPHQFEPLSNNCLLTSTIAA